MKPHSFACNKTHSTIPQFDTTFVCYLPEFLGFRLFKLSILAILSIPPKMARAKKRTSEPHPEPDVEGQGTAALPVRAKDDESAPKLPSGKGNITVFGDSDDEAVPAAPQPAAAKPPKVEESEEEDSSDDDEAPEAVSTQAAASVAKKSSQTAQRAAQE